MSEVQIPQNMDRPAAQKRSITLLTATYACLFVGSIASSLLAKYYFVHGGSSRWVSTWVQSAGCPLLLFLIYFPHYVFKTTTRRPFTYFTRRHLVAAVLIGFMTGFNNLLISWGTSYLPVSTSSLLLSSQLIFTLIFSVFIVKQKITFSNLNCVILLTLSSVLLAIGGLCEDKPIGLKSTNYFMGYLATIGAGLLFSFYLPVTERVYQTFDCYPMVMEMQFIVGVSATVFATIGMAFYGGFTEMFREANHVFNKGPTVYWIVIIVNAVTWQLCFAATSGIVYLTSGITGGICMTALLAMNVMGGVVVFRDKLGGVKIVSTVLCVWGFSSYVYGMIKERKKGEYSGVNTAEEDIGQVQMSQAVADVRV